MADDRLQLIELRYAVITHCQALRDVTNCLANGSTQAAIARLDQAVAALWATINGQCADMDVRCPQCGEVQALAQWVIEHGCAACGHVCELRDLELDEES